METETETETLKANGPWQTVHVESAKNAVSAVQGHWFPGICVIKQVPGICVMKHH